MAVSKHLMYSRCDYTILQCVNVLTRRQPYNFRFCLVPPAHLTIIHDRNMVDKNVSQLELTLHTLAIKLVLQVILEFDLPTIMLYITYNIIIL